MKSPAVPAKVPSPSKLATRSTSWGTPAWLRKVFADVPEILQHTIALVLSVVSIWLVHKVFAGLLGEDAKFFDSIPIKWAFDAAHIAVFARFVWKLVRRIWTK